MQRIFRFCAIALFALSFNASAAADLDIKVWRGKIVKISDGDTINMVPDGGTPDGKPLRIRMISTDTPELHLPGPGGVYSQGYWGEEAAAELRRVVRVGDRIELEDYGRDVYGRVLGKVHHGSMDVNLEMVASGWAALYVICDAVSCEAEASYRAACREAMREGRGIFDPARPLPQLPFVFRSEKQRRPLSKFVGNFRTKKYVEPQNYRDVPLCDRIFFLSESDAKAEGYRPSF